MLSSIAILFFFILQKVKNLFVFLSQYAKLSSDFSPVLLSASDWNFLKGMSDLQTP